VGRRSLTSLAEWIIMHCRTPIRVILLTSLVGILAGCSGSGSSGPEVKGKVLFANGKPLTTGIVIFQPNPKKGNQSKHEARGTIDADGNYTLASEARGQTGIPPGWYRVAVVATKQDPKNEYAPPTWLIPSRYGSVETSNLSYEVKEGAATSAYDIRLAP
jgi:hypothetical protein